MDLAGASGPAGINCIHSLTQTHTCTDGGAHMQCRMRRGRSAESTFPRAAPSEMMKKVLCKCVRRTHTQATASARTGLVHGTSGSMLEQMCANFRAATKRRHRQLCLQSACVGVCVCVSISDTKMPNATLRALMPQSNRVCVRETGGVRIDARTRGGFSSRRSKPRFAVPACSGRREINYNSRRK